MASGKQPGGMIEGINVTPLVDITLVLLIIVIVTAKIIVNPAVPMDLQRAATCEELQIVFAVQLPASGELLVDGEKIRDIPTSAQPMNATARSTRRCAFCSTSTPRPRTFRAAAAAMLRPEWLTESVIFRPSPSPDSRRGAVPRPPVTAKVPVVSPTSRDAVSRASERARLLCTSRWSARDSARQSCCCVSSRAIPSTTREGCAALGVGSSLITPEILKTRNWAELTRLAGEFVRVVRETRAH